MQLYPIRVSREYSQPVTRPELFRLPPGGLLLELFAAVVNVLETEPFWIFREGGTTVTAVFTDASALCTDFEQYAGAFAAVSGTWPVVVSGSTPEKETGKLFFERQDNGIWVRECCASGRKFEILESLSICTEMKSPEEALAMYRILKGLRRNGVCGAVERSMEGFMTKQKIEYFSDGTLFCYPDVGVEPDIQVHLRALSFSHKVRLWRDFLKEDFQPREFAWIYEQQREEAIPLMEWELSLLYCLESLGYVIDHSGDAFTLLDSKGEKCRFDFARGGAAEKLLLRILFPAGI